MRVLICATAIASTLHRSTAIGLALSRKRLRNPERSERRPPPPMPIRGDVLTAHWHAMMSLSKRLLILLHCLHTPFERLVNLNHGWSSSRIGGPTALQNHGQKGRPHGINIWTLLSLDDLDIVVVYCHSFESGLKLEHFVHDNDKRICVCWKIVWFAQNYFWCHVPSTSSLAFGRRKSAKWVFLRGGEGGVERNSVWWHTWHFVVDIGRPLSRIQFLRQTKIKQLESTWRVEAWWNKRTS